MLVYSTDLKVLYGVNSVKLAFVTPLATASGLDDLSRKVAAQAVLSAQASTRIISSATAAAVALVTPNLIPSGAIVMWSGLLAAIPTGWLLCDGANGTPDLSDKFIRGLLPGEEPGATGGANTHTHILI